MKKLILTVSVIVIFTIYGALKKNDQESQIVQNISGDGLNMVESPTSTQNTSVAGNSPSPTSSQTVLNPVTPSIHPTNSGQYKDGEFVGSIENAFYGLVQVKVLIKNAKISDIQFLSYPNDRRTSVFINSQATPILRSEAIQAQSANVSIVSGATDTSKGFIASLSTALAKAK